MRWCGDVLTGRDSADDTGAAVLTRNSLPHRRSSRDSRPALVANSSANHASVAQDPCSDRSDDEACAHSVQRLDTWTCWTALTFGNGMGCRWSVVNTTAVKPTYWQGREEPDSRHRTFPVNIAAVDWDLMLRAVLDRLSHPQVEKPATEGTAARLHAPPGTALGECLHTLDQLRRSVTSGGPQQLTLSARD